MGGYIVGKRHKWQRNPSRKPAKGCEKGKGKLT